MMEAGTNELMVDLVGRDEHIMTGTDLCYPQQLIFGPDTSGRIVRTAEQEEADMVLLYFLLEVIEINRIVVVFQDEWAVDQLAAIIADGLGERVVDRLLDENGLTRFRKGADGHAEGNYDTWSDSQAFGRR